MFLFCLLKSSKYRFFHRHILENKLEKLVSKMHQTVTERTETMMDPALSIQSRDVLFVAHQEHVDQFLCLALGTPENSSLGWTPTITLCITPFIYFESHLSQRLAVALFQNLLSCLAIYLLYRQQLFEGTSWLKWIFGELYRGNNTNS